LAATASAVKSAYDLADAAIAKTTVTTAGDIIYRNATIPTRLGIGTAGQVLTVNSGATAPQWSNAAASKYVLLNQTTMSAVSSQTIDSIFTTSYNSYVIVANGLVMSSANTVSMQLMYSGTAQTSDYYQGGGTIAYNGASVGFNNVANGAGWIPFLTVGSNTTIASGGTMTVTYKGDTVCPLLSFQTWNGNNTVAQFGSGICHTSRTYTGIKIVPAAGTLSGLITIYGVAN
jgi:hypothetical protein